MKSFRATVRQKNGKIENLSIEAVNLEDAKRIAKRKGTLVSISKKAGFSLESGMSVSERQIFLLRLSSMLASKLGATEALIIMQSSFSGNIKKASSKILRNMENGSDIMEAIRQVGQPHFPETIVALLEAGARTGELWKALRHAADFEKEMEKIKQGSGFGLWIGIAGMLFSAILIIGTKYFFLPWFTASQFYQMTAKSIDLSLIDMITNVTTVLMIIMIVLMGGLFMLGTVGRKLAPSFSDNIIMKIPFYKDLILAKNNYTTLFGLALLVGSGVPMEYGLELSARTASKGSLKDDLMRAVDAIKKGRPWAQVMKTLHPTDKAALSVSVDREQISNTLNALSYQYREAYATVISSLAPTLQLISAIFMILAGGILFGYTMLPVLQASANGMGQ